MPYGPQKRQPVPIMPPLREVSACGHAVGVTGGAYQVGTGQTTGFAYR